MKKIIIYGTTTFLLISFCIWIYPKSQGEYSKNPMRIGYNVQSVNYGPIMVAYENNLFNKHGLEVEMVALKSGTEVRHAIATGHIDIGFSSITNILIVISAGAPVKIVAPSTVTKILLFVRPGEEIQTFADLMGKKICGGKGGNSEFVFRRALQKEKIDISEIEFVDVDKEYRGVALVDKKIIDAIPNSRYNQKYFKKFGAVIHKEWQEKGYADELWLSTVIAVNTKYLEENLESIDSFMDAFIESQRFIFRNKKKASQIIIKHINSGTLNVAKYSQKEILDIWNDGTKYTLWYKPNDLIEILSFLFETGLTRKKLSLKEVFDLRFKEKLKFAQNRIYEQ